MEELIAEIQAAATGADIRVPLVRTFSYLFENGREASRLATRPPHDVGFVDWTYFALRHDYTDEEGNVRVGISTLLPFDTWATVPRNGSPKLVSGGTVYAVCGNIPLLIEELEDLLHG